MAMEAQKDREREERRDHPLLGEAKCTQRAAGRSLGFELQGA